MSIKRDVSMRFNLGKQKNTVVWFAIVENKGLITRSLMFQPVPRLQNLIYTSKHTYIINLQ